MDRVNETMQDILQSSNKLINRAENAPAILWRKILFDRGIGAKTFRFKVDRYLNNPLNGIKEDNLSKQNHRGNLMKELASPRMTWAVFEKGLRVLDTARITLQVYLEDGTTGTITRHEHVINNYPVGQYSLEEFPPHIVVNEVPHMPENSATDVSPPTSTEPSNVQKAAEYLKSQMEARKK